MPPSQKPSDEPGGGGVAGKEWFNSRCMEFWYDLRCWSRKESFDLLNGQTNDEIVKIKQFAASSKRVW